MFLTMPQLFDLMVESGASDVHITVGRPPVLRVHGRLKNVRHPPLTSADTMTLADGDTVTGTKLTISGTNINAFIGSNGGEDGTAANHTGLNLTGADTVVHFDPWWNPAAEAQATDRAHRIGQKRVVTSYKLIATATVEEKVLALQAEKRALLADVFEASDALAAKLSLADLKSLLK